MIFALKADTPKRSIWFVVFCLFFSSFALAEESKKTSIYDHPDFDSLQKVLAQIVTEHFYGRQFDRNSVNHFYIARYPKDAIETFIFWQEGRLLWPIYLKVPEGIEPWESVKMPTYKTVIQLDTMVVADAEAVGTSTYLVDRAWAAEKIYQAVVEGDLIPVDTNAKKEGNE